jgi:hypothetical protein
LAFSVGLRNFRLELNIGRGIVENSHHPGVRDAVLRHLRFTDDDQERAREILVRARRAKRRRTGTQTPPLSQPGSGNGAGRTPPSAPRAATPPNFWAALSPAQQGEFRMLADERTFAAGARLMQEGETADYVIVILDGRTRISVRGSNGIERVVAHRGPGQLVGERAALRVNVRSATVVALEQVQALAMITANFATFLTAHPDALQLVEEQVYDRLTNTREEALPVTSQRVSVEGMSNTMQSETVSYQLDGTTANQSPQWEGQNCTTIFSDVVAFGSPVRSEEHRRIIRREVLDMTRASLRAVWNQCHYEDRGDGLLVVVPPSVPTVQILEYLLIALPIALKRHNSLYAEGAKIQLRVALDVGPVTTDELGVSGQVIINAARLLEATAFKAAMDDTQAFLGMIVSDFVFQSAVTEAGSLTDPASYSETIVRVKKTHLRAWTLLVEPPVDASPREKLASVVCD